MIIKEEKKMKEINQIVVPVDFAKQTEKLVEFAGYMATKLSAKISFVHVTEFFQGYDMMLGSISFKDVEEKLKAANDEKMKNLIEDNSATCNGGKVLSGDKVDSILDYIEKQKADLVIMGTHGTKGLEKILLGSVAERVLKRSPCPVLTFNPYR